MTTNNNTPGNRIFAAYEAATPEKNLAYYNDWAERYDADMAETEYISVEIAAALFAEQVADKSLTILDAGCGTGLCGQALQQLGYNTIDGVDLSPRMLAQAKEKNIYRRLSEGDLLAGLPFEARAYDAAICVGTFTVGHVGAAGIGEILRVVKAGGIFVLTVNERVYKKEGFSLYIRALQDNGRATVASEKKDRYVVSTDAKLHYIALNVL